MRKIVEKQADSTLLTKISENGNNFAVLAYAATGNPRILLKTVSAAPKMNSTQINSVMRDFYRINIWTEHSALAEKFLGYKPIIDWGRNFIEDNVLRELQQKNDSYIKQEKNSTSFIWVHRDAPQAVKEALRILCYSGILTEQDDGIRATRGEVGRRYIVNLGCLFAREATPSVTAFDIARLLTPKRMSEYGANHQAYEALNAQNFNVNDAVEGLDLNKQLSKRNFVLDITEWQRSKLDELGLNTVRDVLEASEDDIKQVRYVGDVRARKIRNAAIVSVFEYLAG
jgi:hypothetical protein